MLSNVELNIPGLKSSDQQWIQWHKDLKDTFGKKMANSLFLAYWEKRQSYSANTHDLRTYATGQGFKIDGDILSGITDAGFSVTDSIGDILKVGKWVGIGLAVILVGGIGLLVYNVAKDPGKIIGAIKP